MLGAIDLYSRAFAMMSRNRWWGYALIPGLVSLVLAGAVVWGAIGAADHAGDWLMRRYPFEWGRGFVSGLADVLAGLLMALAALTLLKTLVQAALSPFMSMLSEQAEARLSGAQVPAPGLAGILSDIWRGLRISLRNLWRELLYVLGLTLLGMLIPGIGSVLSTIAVFAVQAYYAGFSNMDYTLERHRYPVAESVRFVRAHRGLAIGNGAVFLLLLMIPVAGLFLAPVLGTVAATLGILDLQPRKP